MTRVRHRRKDVRSVGDRDDTAEVEQLRRRIDELEAALARVEGAVRPPMDGDARLRDILEACPIGIAILDEEDGRRMFVNSALVDILGAGSREQLLQGDIATTWVDPSRLDEAWSAFQENKNLLNFEAERKRLDGSRWWVLMNTQPITFEGVAAGIVWHVDITPRKQAEAALSESEARLRAIIDNYPSLITLKDLDGRFLLVNEGYAKSRNTSIEDATGKTVGDFETPDHAASVAAHDREAFERGEAVTYERDWFGFGQKGLLRTVTKFPAYDADGQLMGIGTISIDISDRKKAEEARQESEGLLNSIIENVPVGLLVKDADHIVEWANSTYLNWYGFDANTMVGRKSDEIEDFQSADEAAFMNAQELEVLTTGLTRARQVERPFADGQVHTVSITKFPIYDQQGNIIKVGSASVDLTEQVEARNALAHSEMRFRDFAQSASDRFWETDEQHRFTFVSNPGDKNLIPRGDEILGETRWSAAGVIPEAQENWRKHLADLDARRSFKDFVFLHRRPDGNARHFSVSGIPIFDGDGSFKGYRGTARDITAEVEAVRAIESAKEAADQANQTKTEFLANLSHELRTPLAAITGFSELLATGIFGPIGNAQYQQYAEDIYASGTHLLALINDILDASLIETKKVKINDKIVDVRELVSNCTKMVAERAARGDIILSSRVAKNVSSVRADSIRLAQILLNLLTNAIKFTPAKGEVVVRVEADADNGVRFMVDDTGIGITPEDVSRVVEPFVQVGNVETRGPEGTGLGLTLAKSLTELHGGNLTIESDLGVGTTVTVRLPSDRNVGMADVV